MQDSALQSRKSEIMPSSVLGRLLQTSVKPASLKFSTSTSLKDASSLPAKKPVGAFRGGYAIRFSLTMMLSFDLAIVLSSS